MSAIDIHKIMKGLAVDRSAFCSEADFQFAFAQEIRKQYPSAEIWLEYPVDLLDFKKAWHVDIAVFLGDDFIPIELKYKTAGGVFESGKQLFVLKKQGAQDQGRYDFIADIYRIEKVVSFTNAKHGYVIMLTNDHLYWEKPSRQTIDQEFRIHTDACIYKKRAWKKGTCDGTKRGRAADIELTGTYKIKWLPYSLDESKNFRKFRYTAVEFAKKRDASENVS